MPGPSRFLVRRNGLPVTGKPGVDVRAGNIRELENAVFERWERQCPEMCGNLVRDGVADPAAFFSAPVRVLFILKEPYSSRADWDFRETLHTELKTGRTWNNASRWVEAALNSRSPLPWSAVAIQNQETRRAAMTRVAFMNLKKKPGGARSSTKEIRRFIERYRTHLLDQIDLYGPQITILGGTAPFLGDLFGSNQGPLVLFSGVRCRRIDSLGFAVRMPHPQASRSARNSYETLSAALAEISARGCST